MQVTLPTRTAGICELPNGQSVWIQTVNALQREQAREAADLAAAREARPFRRSGEGYRALREQFEECGAELLGGYLADCGYLAGSYQREAEQRFPPAEPPVRDEGEGDDAFDQRVAAWDEQRARAAQQRADHIEQRYEAVKREASALSEAERIERCCREAYELKRREAFGTRFVLELLARAVRNVEDHRRPIYAGSDEVADLADEIRDALLAAYFRCDPVSPAQVPTWAGCS
jgi:hypothetical protein